MKTNDPRVFNITLKVTADMKSEFSRIATSHGLSVSEWGAMLLTRFRHSYGEDSHTEKIHYFLNLMIEDLEKQDEELKEMMDKPYGSELQKDFYNIFHPRIIVRIVELEKFKRRVEEHLF